MATTAEDPITSGTDAPAIDLPVTPAVTPSRAQRSRGRPRPVGPRRTKVTVRRFGITSVLKFSLIFSFCAMLIVWLALLIIFLVLQAGGAIESLSETIGCVVNGSEGTKKCIPATIDGKVVFTYLFFGGCALAAAWALVMTFAAVIYNLISDMVGGVEVTLAEKGR